MLHLYILGNSTGVYYYKRFFSLFFHLPDGAGRYAETGQFEKEIYVEERAYVYQCIHFSGENIGLKLIMHKTGMKII